MDEDNLGCVSNQSNVGCGRWAEEEVWRGTYAVGKVGDEVLNDDLADFELTVQPAAVRLAAWYSQQ